MSNSRITYIMPENEMNQTNSTLQQNSDVLSYVRNEVCFSLIKSNRIKEKDLRSYTKFVHGVDKMSC
jgi:hypothetical protein